MKLQEIKEQYAKEIGQNSWRYFLKDAFSKHIDLAVNEISKRYAKAKLEESAEKIKTLALKSKELENEDSPIGLMHMGKTNGYTNSILILKASAKNKATTDISINETA